MTMALPASRAAVGMVAVAVPAVSTRPPGRETYEIVCLPKISVFAFQDQFVFLRVFVFLHVFVFLNIN